MNHEDVPNCLVWGEAQESISFSPDIFGGRHLAFELLCVPLFSLLDTYSPNSSFVDSILYMSLQGKGR